MWKKMFLILITIFLLLNVFLLVGCSSNKKTYEEACQLAREGDIDSARTLFSQLPADYRPDTSKPDAYTWIEGIDKYVDSPFIGIWKNGTYIIEITLEVDNYSGVHLEYDKEYTSPGGVRVWDYGYVGVEDDGKTAYYYRGHQSNAKNYTLILSDENTMEVWFDGINGYEKEITLHRKLTTMIQKP